MRAVPLHIRRRLEQRWASRFTAPAASSTSKDVGTKPTCQNQLVAPRCGEDQGKTRRHKLAESRPLSAVRARDRSPPDSPPTLAGGSAHYPRRRCAEPSHEGALVDADRVESIMATMRPLENGAAATVSNYRPQKRGPEPSALNRPRRHALQIDCRCHRASSPFLSAAIFSLSAYRRRLGSLALEQRDDGSRSEGREIRKQDRPV
jgi:hypothetical protein